ncbi:hypothetical protein GT642_06560 [Butyricicoccus sp. BIOML-A1]|nr:GcrA family cell cycle regulator [Butyricicoccus sp. BIOML-A1]MZT26615.1 hypothetical protein [Butyricicoccus sp. BIOML-A1]
MQNNNFAETLASVASEFGVEDTAKHGRGIKPSKRPYFRWTEEQLEQLATLRDEGKSAAEIAEALGVSRDKVITKLAAMAARQRAGSKTPEQSTEPVAEAEAEAEPEQEAETEPSVEAEPEPEFNPVSQDLNPTDVDLDRMIFTAFDNVVGKVDDFVTMSGCWRKVLTTIEKQLNELAYLVWEHPNTEESVCQIAAIVAYDEIRA